MLKDDWACPECGVNACRMVAVVIRETADRVPFSGWDAGIWPVALHTDSYECPSGHSWAVVDALVTDRRVTERLNATSRKTS